MTQARRLTTAIVTLFVCLLATITPAIAAGPTSSADISLVVRDASGRAGEVLFTDFRVFNAGPDTATGIVATLELSVGLELVQDSSGTCRTSDRIVTCSLGELPPAAGGGVIWGLRAAEPGTYTITGSASSAVVDPVTANNSDTGQIVIAPSGADLSVDVPDAAAAAGSDFFYSFGLFNAGPGSATGVVGTFELPAGLELVGNGAGCSIAGRIVTCPGSSPLPANTGVRGIWMLRAASAGTFVISGSVTGDQQDPNPGNNTDSGTITVTSSADIAVAVADSMDPIKPGQGVTYTTVVTNNGPSTATNVTLSETWSMSSAKDLSAGGVTTSQGACTLVGMRLDCQFGTLVSGGSATATVSLKPRGGGTLTMTANASATEPDPTGGNNSATETTTVGPK
jgi:hypothetical protein